jgi:hypothetical protein
MKVGVADPFAWYTLTTKMAPNLGNLPFQMTVDYRLNRPLALYFQAFHQKAVIQISVDKKEITATRLRNLPRPICANGAQPAA